MSTLRKVLPLFLLLPPLFSQGNQNNVQLGVVDASASAWKFPTRLFANLPAAASSTGQRFTVTDCLTSACTAGSGALRQDMVSNGSAWVTAVSPAAPGTSAYTTVTYSATPTFTVSASTIVQNFLITLTGNVTSSTLTTTAATAGQDIAFNICQDGSGAHTFVWPSNVTGAGTISAVASACSRQIFRFDSTNAIAVSVMYATGSGGAITLNGSSSGSNTISPAAAAGAGSTTYLPSGASTTVIPDAGASHDFLTAISVLGIISKSQPSCSDLSDSSTGCNATNVTLTIATGTATLGTGAISANTCASAVQPTASTGTLTGVATTDTIAWTPNADISGVTGYGALATDGLIIYPFASTNHVNFTVCNATGTSITPGAATLNWAVRR